MTDEKLINDFKSGDIKAFEILIKKYKTMIFNTAYSVVSNLNDAEDVAQDVFITLYRSLKSFKFNCALSSWLYRITINKSLNRLREKKNFVVLDDNLQIENKDLTSDISAHKKRLELQRLINTLPAKYRAIITLKEFENLSYKEISDVMKISINKVKVWLFRAREMLKEKITSE